jgi:2'-5' RNA ligase
MRLFTAIDIPDEIREALRTIVARWKPLAKISWSPIGNLHITTKFIGEWPEPRLEEMKRTLASVQPGGPIDIAIREIGWFPNERRPRALWAGIEADEALAKLAHATEQAVAAIGVLVEDRPFSPHLTLARIRETVPLEALRAATAKSKADFGSFQAREFSLYLSAAGRYTALATFPLRPSPLRSSSL